MPRITLSIQSQKNTGVVLSAQDIKKYYLAGLPLPDTINDDFLNFHIDSCVTELENFLQLRLRKQIIIENKDFYRDDWVQWGYIRASYPVVCAIQLDGYLGTTKQISYPRDWLSVRKTNDNRLYSRMMYLVPNRNSSHSEAIIYSGLFPQQNYFASRTIPDYWTLKYVTGWDKIPSDILGALAIMVTTSVLQQISDALMVGSMRQTLNAQGQPILVQSGGVGFGLGISSKSISIDGLSQSYSSYVNGQTGLFGARLKQYLDMLDPKKPGSMLNKLYDTYGAITWGVA